MASTGGLFNNLQVTCFDSFILLYSFSKHSAGRNMGHGRAEERSLELDEKEIKGERWNVFIRTNWCII